MRRSVDHYRSSKPKNAAPVNKRHSASKGNYRCGEVYYAKDVKFDGSEGSKDRPVICLSVNGDAMRCLKCTSTGGARGLYEILDYIGAGLDHATYVDPKPFNLPRSKIVRYMGELNEVDYCNLGLDDLRPAAVRGNLIIGIAGYVIHGEAERRHRRAHRQVPGHHPQGP